MNDQSDQQCKFLGVHTASSRGALAVGGVVPKLESVSGVNICNANANSPEAAKFRIPYFRPSKCRHPAQCRPGRMPPLAPFSGNSNQSRCILILLAYTAHYRLSSYELYKSVIDVCTDIDIDKHSRY